MTMSEKLQNIAENMSRVYEAGASSGEGSGGNYDEGYAKGYEEGYTKGDAAGREAQESTFWDAYQQNGERVDYQLVFAGRAWNDITFEPKYDIRPNSFYSTFQYSGVTDLKAALERCGATLDLSNATLVSNAFADSLITHLGELRLTKVSNLSMFLYKASALISIDKLILKSDGSQSFNNLQSFGQCNQLEHMPVEGVIGQSVNLQWSPLDLESATSIILALKDYKGTANDLKYKVTLSETTFNTLTATGNAAPGGVTWVEYATSKGWGVE